MAFNAVDIKKVVPAYVFLQLLYYTGDLSIGCKRLLLILGINVLENFHENIKENTLLGVLGNTIEEACGDTAFSSLRY